MSGLFITSTGTGIGKTFLTEQLLCLDYARERRLSASKPIISGWTADPKLIPSTDTVRLLLAQNSLINDDTIAALSPWRYYAPLAPSRAASVERRPINLNALLAFCQERQKTAALEQKLHLFEGVGGVMVPILNNWLVTDWIKALNCPALLVIGSYLGTISHTLTAVAVLEAHKIPLLGIVISESPLSDIPLVETFETLQELLPSTLITLLPSNETQRNRSLNSLYTILLQHAVSTTMPALQIPSIA